jgi:hypothetical protein
MRTVAVTARDGAQWRVRIAWEPRWHALSRRIGGWRQKRRERRSDFDGGGLAANLVPVTDDLTTTVVLILGFIVGIALFWWLLLPLLLLVLDIVIVLVLLVIGVAARVLFRRPWRIEGSSDRAGTVVREVVGWRAALRARDELAESLRLSAQPHRAAP